MVSDEYKMPDHKLIFGVGVEWLVPIGIVSFPAVLLLCCMGASLLFILTAGITGIAWGLFSFDTVHTQMHLKRTKWVQNKYLAKWFKRAKKLHHVHHHHLDEEGKMDSNFGIGLFVLDRIFGTFRERA